MIHIKLKDYLHKVFSSLLHILSGILILILTISHSFSTNNPQSEMKLGLVLSGGGAKGFAHIGVLKVLEEENIPVSLITGTSIGSIVGGLYSIGYTADELEQFAKSQDWENLLSDGVPRTLKSAFKQNYEQKYLLELLLNQEKRKLTLPSGLIHGNNALNALCGFTASLPEETDFTEFPIPFACVAYSLNNGEEVVLDNGYLPLAILSSIAIPGVFSPVKYKGMHLLDGGILNNFPVDVARDMGANLVIGVDLKQDYETEPEFESITDIFQEIVGNVMSEKHIQNAALADLVIRPDLGDISALDFEAELVDSIIRLGEKAARKQLQAIKALIKNKKIIDKKNEKNLKADSEWFITAIEIPEKFDEEANFILNKLNLPLNSTYTVEDIKLATTRVFAYGNFELVYYTIVPNATGYSLRLHINQKKQTKIMLGLGLNTTDVSGLYFNYSQQSYSNIISLLTLDAKFAFNPQLKIHLETHKLIFSILAFELEGRFNQVNYFNANNDKLGNLDLGNASAILYSYRRFRNRADLGAGIKQQYIGSYAYGNGNAPFTTEDLETFFTRFYIFFNVDYQDDAYIPTRGIYLNSALSFLSYSDNMQEFDPVFALNFRSSIPLSNKLSLMTAVYHRSMYHMDNYPPNFMNYSSNPYNSYSTFYFPLLGRQGISYLKNVSNMGDIGIRVKIGKHHYITPMVQVLLESDDWKSLDFSKLKYSSGLRYQTTTFAGPVDITLGFQGGFRSMIIHGGIGYQF